MTVPFLSQAYSKPLKVTEVMQLTNYKTTLTNTKMDKPVLPFGGLSATELHLKRQCQ
jgi:hypothetical protein